MALIKCKECGNEVSDKAESCPKCGAKVEKPVGLAAKIIGGFFVLIILAVVLTPDEVSQQSNSPAQAAVMEPSFSTTAAEIAAAYHENTVAADNRFKGQFFTVTGVISDINTDFMDNAVLILRGGVNEFLEPQFKLLDNYKEQSGALRKGMKVTLNCTGAGDIAKTPMMEDCSIL